MHKLRIGLHLMWRNGTGYANHIGDDTVACAWQKYIMRRDDVCAVYIGGPGDVFTGVDCVIHFHHDLLRTDGVKNFYYLQNAWPRNEHWPNGTVGVFNDHKERFDGYIFASEKLRNACRSPGLVLPFATDPERFRYQYDARFVHPYAFVGNDIRGPEADRKYLYPAAVHGLSIYGGPRNDPNLEAIRKGRISDEDLPKLYSSSGVNLNYHIPIAAEYGMMNMRLYEVAACGGNLLSDRFLNGFRSDAYDGPIEHYEFASLTDETKAHNLNEVITKHTWAHRMETLMVHLKDVL